LYLSITSLSLLSFPTRRSSDLEKDTNTNWLCWPSFQDSFVFGSLLDQNLGGTFRVSPYEAPLNNRQFYLENTNILCTEIEAKDGDRKSTRLNSSHVKISYAVFC